MKKGDILVCLLVFLAGVVLFFAQFGSNTADAVEIYSDGELFGEYDLHTEKVLTVKSEHGYNIVAIENGFVFVIESDCEDKDEILQGKINREGQSLICLPNRMVVTVKGRGGSVDSISY